MKIINFGSLNVDYVYQVEGIVRPGETISASRLNLYPGGKGANQSVAMARAGAEVWHAGMVGRDTEWLRGILEQEGILIRHVRISEEIPGGHAIIQVDAHGQNSIIVLGGTNQALPQEQMAEVLNEAVPGDWLALQNEINLTPSLMRAAHEAGLKVCLNPAPFTSAVLDYPLDCVDLLVVNEIEASGLAGLPDTESPEKLADALAVRCPDAMLCITLGSKGAFFRSAEGDLYQKAFPVKAVDTTAAGDTFVGYLLASFTQGLKPAEALCRAAQAASISVTRHGAIPSIPKAAELKEN